MISICIKVFSFVTNDFGLRSQADLKAKTPKISILKMLMLLDSIDTAQII